jgi:hypothetical protein
MVQRAYVKVRDKRIVHPKSQVACGIETIAQLLVQPRRSAVDLGRLGADDLKC